MIHSFVACEYCPSIDSIAFGDIRSIYCGCTDHLYAVILMNSKNHLIVCHIAL